MSARIASLRSPHCRLKSSIRKKGAWGQQMTSSAAPPGNEIHGVIKHLLEEQYAFVGGDRVQDMLIGDLIRIFQQYRVINGSSK